MVWRMDRAFRSVLDAATTLERLRAWGVGLRSYSEPWLDTTSPFGEALYYITVAYAQLERGILRERVKAGMERARQQGHQIGRPRVMDRRGFQGRFGAILIRLSAGQVSRRQAAIELGKLKGKRATNALIKALDDPNMAVRSNAAFALGELGSVKAVPNLILLLNDNHERVRKSAAKTLGLLKAVDAVLPLIQSLNDGSHIVRKSAIRSLGQIGDPRALEIIEHAVSDSNQVVANMAKTVIAELKKSP